jgi:glycosyltransferase involved in cell wall biosynthesis
LIGRLPRADVPALVRSADAVVCVPYYEPFGIVPLEAMACGIPPVVSAVGGLRESVLDGRTGLHVPPGDPRTLAETLGRLFGDPTRMRGLGAAGVVRARSDYGWRRVAADTARVYASVVARRSVKTFAGSPVR